MTPKSAPLLRRSITASSATSVSYTHLDVYKRQGRNLPPSPTTMRLAASESISCAYSLSATSEKSSADDAANPHFSRACASVRDVYKRQAPQPNVLPAMCLKNYRANPFPFKFCKVSVILRIESASVSYTHLDVYKRQICESALPADDPPPIVLDDALVRDRKSVV